jgi:hypothetical protein
VLGKEKEADGDWQDGLEGTFKKYIWHNWNPGLEDYPDKIANTVPMFIPQ